MNDKIITQVPERGNESIKRSLNRAFTSRPTFKRYDCLNEYLPKTSNMSQNAQDLRRKMEVITEEQEEEEKNGNKHICKGDQVLHLNIEEKHYYMTKDQLLSFPDTLLLRMFPKRMFLTKCGTAIQPIFSMTDEIYVESFPSSCFEYMMSIYTAARNDLKKYYSYSIPHFKVFKERKEHQLLYKNPLILVLKEDLDYYCIPGMEFEFEFEFTEGQNDKLDYSTRKWINDDLSELAFSQIKIAASEYFLDEQNGIFHGIITSNANKNIPYLSKMGTDDGIDLDRIASKMNIAERNLVEMLQSSGFNSKSKWAYRIQEPDKTTISSLSLGRIYNGTEVRDRRGKSSKNVRKVRRIKRERKYNERNIFSMSHLESSSNCHFAKNNNNRDNFANSMNREYHSENEDIEPDCEGKELPNVSKKLLLFWKKPAKKNWWSSETVNLQVELYGKLKKNNGKIKRSERKKIIILRKQL
ncbi:uncharacterized protein NDAI_0H00780 [Naumovozyma dairenensis CBS 421]|uniref:Uncharacterized protein n=1 Tax=Naumovozyma dairenensis (strain ATCC 10597 / BCRC 20456 / CBS 421 / NBRC 0211 / NRRL Y-12639) TaxID=1071378 RepID=G0WEP1_NAUDC|nr:hypothetical protein NDAI_0H00780 [Naumovozyma dairenensis CBS 421]CCD26252.1 hypothetical protein NDAI_0H00780 [Naumovozyma dairenensis CBS 421]